MLEELLQTIKKYNKNTDVDLITKAYKMAELKHEGQLRNSGEEYFIHPVAVSKILAGLEMDDPTICAGLMHDLLEDTDYSKEEMIADFGEEITVLVDGVTKLTKLKNQTKEENQNENIRKMVLAMANDIRVIIIKLSDRLHNLRTLEYMAREKQIAKAQETLDIYIPLAHRLGINTVKWELEDLCLRYLDPIAYYSIAEDISQKRSEREKVISEIISILTEELNKLNIKCTITGRPKGIYSIYNKMKKQNSSIDNIYDLIAVRVIVESINECYAVLGVVHNIWKPLIGRFKDYISMPKQNMYQSLHTTVIGLKGQIFEIQIRTYEMHQTAEYGIAAHWKYKEGKSKVSNFDQRLTWIRQLMEWGANTRDSKEFMETFKGDLFSDEVYIFSPKGDLIDLPAGASPVDFAYRVHTDVGNRCVGAKVNGKIVPLNYKLQTGDIVEILTSSNSTGPSKDWLDIVVSSQAKTKIKQYFKKEKRDSNIEIGKEKLEKEIRKKGYDSSKVLIDEWLQDAAEKNNLLTINDLYAGIGYGSVNLNSLIIKLESKYEQNAIEEKNLSDYQDNVEELNHDNINNDSVSVDEVNNLESKFAKCCNPVPGDKIVGYITKGRGITIHRSDCKNILSLQNKERLIEVKWDSPQGTKYSVKLNIISLDNPGYLAELTKVISKEGFNLAGISARPNKDTTFTISLIIKIEEASQLEKLFTKIRKIKGTLDVYRVKS
ncbi:MAG: bifunctional (p)ppGpp synthetase/guanosine-3',5'-bis(diphosphate) 3'-pyrophosphohydrolase [Tissierellia bacterium]|nr:bifunctional (p)ppGpp synthetase/guanosine-3',5'-bis(diphosphate) 3'-pyrophosphohydrolase [Tissierellia bacterium]